MARLSLLALGVISLLFAACTGSGPTTGPTAGSTQAPTQGAVTTPAPTPDACAPENLQTMTAGTLTIGADNPAYPPYYIPEESPPAGSEWELGYPPNGKGLEGATAYAVAEQLGFSADDVVWVVAPFNTAIQPGDKNFDLYLTQVSYSEERTAAVDLTDGYFDLNQAVVTVASSPLAQVTTFAGLKDFKLGTQVGTTSYQYIVDHIQPTQDPAVFDSMDAAVQALQAGSIQGVVADLPTTFYMRDAQLDDGVIVGSLPTAAGAEVEHFSILLDKGSSLTSCVNEALAALKADGTLDAIRQEWIAGGGAPVLE